MVSRKTKIYGTIGAVVVAGAIAFGAISGHSGEGTAKKGYSVAMITDTASTVLDRSFNEVSWDGLQSWGKEHGYKQGQNYDYFLSKSPSDWNQNFQLAQKQGYKLQAGVGFDLHSTLVKNAKANPKTDYVLVDDIASGQKNVASLMFKSEQSSYLAGVVAATQAKESNSKTVGFIGGMKGPVIDRFQAGYIDGVKSVDKDIKVQVVYVNSYTDAPKGQTIAKTMLAQGTKVIFAAAGSAGNGAFTAVKQDNAGLDADSKDKAYMIGVDIDQYNDGIYTSKDGKKQSATLTTSLTEVGNGLKDIANKSMKGHFPGGKTIWYGLKEKGVGITTNNLNDEQKKAVTTAEKGIISGSIKVKSAPESYSALQ